MKAPKDYRVERVTLAEAEFALRKVIGSEPLQDMPTLQALCVALLGVSDAISRLQRDVDLIANRMSVIARESQVDFHGGYPRLENE